MNTELGLEEVASELEVSSGEVRSMIHGQLAAITLAWLIDNTLAVFNEVRPRSALELRGGERKRRPSQH